VRAVKGKPVFQRKIADQKSSISGLAWLLRAGFLPVLLFYPDVGGDLFLRNFDMLKPVTCFNMPKNITTMLINALEIRYSSLRRMHFGNFHLLQDEKNRVGC
jgi:hypothetical protein